MQPKTQRLTIIFLFIVILSLANIGSAQEQTTISLPSLDFDVGGSALVEAEIDCMSEVCGSFAITITFDPAVLQIDEVEVGPYLGDSASVTENTVDNEEGTLVLEVTATGEPSEEPESNILFQFTITALAEGEAVLEVTEFSLSDGDSNELEVVTVDGTVFIPANNLEATPEVTPEPEPEPCWVRNDDSQAEIPVRVGPGSNRGTRSWFPLAEDVLVVGQYEDEDGNIWWRIQPENYVEAEADRYWVTEVDVEEIGDCDRVGEAQASRLIIGGGGGGGTSGGGGGTGSGGTINTDAPFDIELVSYGWDEAYGGRLRFDLDVFAAEYTASWLANTTYGTRWGFYGIATYVFNGQTRLRTAYSTGSVYPTGNIQQAATYYSGCSTGQEITMVLFEFYADDTAYSESFPISFTCPEVAPPIN